MYTTYSTETMAIELALEEVFRDVFGSMNGDIVSVRVYADISILYWLALIAPFAYGVDAYSLADTAVIFLNLHIR